MGEFPSSLDTPLQIKNFSSFLLIFRSKEYFLTDGLDELYNLCNQKIKTELQNANWITLMINKVDSGLIIVSAYFLDQNLIMKHVVILNEIESQLFQISYINSKILTDHDIALEKMVVILYKDFYQIDSSKEIFGVNAFSTFADDIENVSCFQGRRCQGCIPEDYF